MIVSAAILKDGVVYTGKRHHNIIHDNISHKVGKHPHIQGFVNHKGEFLNREEAAIEAMDCGQVVKGHANLRHVFDGKTLYSEDYC